jgi:hypothetical protein
VKLAFLALMLAACSITHRSDAYACSKPSDCSNGRQCIGGFCVVADSIDASRGDAKKPVDASTCPTPCTSCNVAEKACTIDCGASTACIGPVTCPTGYSCNIECKTDNSCRNGVDCQLASSCQITCSGQSACRSVQCGTGPCAVTCSGPGSCRGVACDQSCSCDVACSGNLSCIGAIQCHPAICQSGSGCTSAPSFCHSCP